MERIDELKIQLIDAIKNSEEYREYHKYQDIINRTPDLKRQIDDYRRQNFYIQNSDEIEDVFIATEELNKRFADLRRQDLAVRYLNTEIAFCSFVRDICTSIADGIDFELDFFY